MSGTVQIVTAAVAMLICAGLLGVAPFSGRETDCYFVAGFMAGGVFMWSVVGRFSR